MTPAQLYAVVCARHEAGHPIPVDYLAKLEAAGYEISRFT